MSLKEDISRILGPEKVSGAPDVLAAHAGDKWYASVLPEAVVFPESTEDVSLLLRYASSMNIPVTARGGGVGYVGGCVPVRGGISLSLERMNRILEISPEDGVAVVEPGVITADLQREARALGWFYPPDPASRKECSIGGNIATNAGGPRCLKYGVTRAYVLGLTVVLASGEVVECGGRTHKNKTGFDIGDLFIGSEGMLGIITRAVLRLIPHPEAFGALSAGFPQFPLAAAAVQALEAHDRLLACGDAAVGALLESRLEKVPGAEKVYDFGTMSYADAKVGPQIEKRVRAKLGGEGDKPDPVRLALARAQAARRIVGTELAVACAERESDHVLVLSTKKGCWLRTVSAADNPGLWLLDMVRRAAAGLPQAEGTGFLPAGQVKQSDPPGRSQSKDPTPKKKHLLRVLLAVLVILALAAFGVAWYLTDGDLAALPQRLKTLRLPEWVTLWQAHEPKPGARLI